MLKINSRKLRTNLHDLGQAVNVISTGRWIFYCVILGVIAGFSAILFSYLLDLIQNIAITNLTGVPMPKPGGEAAQPTGNTLNFLVLHLHWLILVLPTVGGLISGYLVFRFAPEAEGHGTDAVIRSFHHNKGYIRPAVPFVKIIASAFTIGTGGSAGKEGPIAQIVAGIGSFMGTKLNMSVRERKILVTAGIGAGIGAIFKAPIGGALFASEVFYRKDFESEGLVASIISSIVGYSIYASFDGWDPIFSFNPITFTNPYELPLFILLALVVMVFGIIYTKVFYGTKTLFDKLKMPRHVKPALGGLLVGIIAYFFPAVLGSSYGYLQAALDGHLAVTFMFALVAFKIIATSLTISSGGSGGVFAPSLVIGGLLGGVFGFGLQAIYPGTMSSPEAYVLVGMASFFAGAANVPIASTIMITEMSKSYGLLVPLIFASSIAYLGAQNWSIYKEQLEDRLSSAAYRDDFLNEVLRTIKVRAAFQRVKNMPVISHRCRVSEILDKFTEAETLILPVEDDEKNVVGMISLYDVRDLLQKDVGDIIIAADIMVPPKLLHLNDPMSKAFNYFRESGEPEIPVLQHGSKRKFIGVLSERNFLLSYERAMTTQNRA